MNPFPNGMVWIFQGQAYQPLGTREYVGRSGEAVTLIDWTSDCAECGNEFPVSTTLRFEYPNRRCDDCKKPRVRVRRRASKVKP